MLGFTLDILLDFKSDDIQTSKLFSLKISGCYTIRITQKPMSTDFQGWKKDLPKEESIFFVDQQEWMAGKLFFRSSLKDV